MRVSVVGSGPNGLAAAVIMARAGFEVTVYEAQAKPGGGLRTDQFSGFAGIFDVCAAVHPMALSSKFFREFQVTERVRFLQSEIAYAHALPGRAAVAYRDLDRTVGELGACGRGWARVMRPLVSSITGVRAMSGLEIGADLSTVRGAMALAAAAVGFSTLRGDARALAAGVIAHGAAPFNSFAARFVGAVLAAEGHVSGWPVAAGGSAAIAAALVEDLRAHGGRISVNHPVTDIRDVWQPGDIAFLDTGPLAFAAMAEQSLPVNYVSALRRYRYGNAASKIDLVLSAPIPWADDRLRDAITVHLGGPEQEVSAAEGDARRGAASRTPYVLLSQPTRVDRSRLPGGSSHEIVWAYAHVPNGSRVDASELIISRIESYAPGFRDVILHSESRPAPFFADLNANFVGGDVLGGKVDAAQLLTRPTVSARPWRTPVPGVYLCSASTPPGAGVHGMAGWHAARLALKQAGLEMPGLGLSIS